jgi:tRNA U34 5-methylaminomethyl-2-thiouridine-forming methyltransferase MnmC
MKREIVITEDGSSSLFVESIQEQFHSKFGAIQEAIHIFIENGLLYVLPKLDGKISILEIGFGTGLNCFLTCIRPEIINYHLYYEGVELYPLNETEYSALNYPKLVSPENQPLFNHIHQLPWETIQNVRNSLFLKKKEISFTQLILDSNQFDLVYFDPFSPDKQPEMWTQDRFEMVYRAMNPGGVLVTYCTKGIVKRALKAAGFQIEKLPGPTGKREILRATR